MLPRPGKITEDLHSDATSYLTGIAEESRDGVAPFLGLAQACINLYTWGDVDPIDNPDRIVVHEIQNSIIAITDIQTKEPPSATLEPVETGEPPLFFWAGPPEAGMQFGLQSFEVDQWADETGELQPPLPLDQQMGEMLQGMAIPKEAALLGMPGGVRNDWIVGVDDREVADVYQVVFDVIWQRSQVDLWIRQNLLDTNIQGWAWGLYEFDDNNKRHVLKHLPVTQVHIDPTARDIADAMYSGIDLPFDADEAKAIYPHLAADIEAAAEVGIPSSPDNNAQWSQQFDRRFSRRMVTFRVFWLRNQRYPMTEDEALAMGAVEQREVFDEPALPTESGETGLGIGSVSSEGLGAGAAVIDKPVRADGESENVPGFPFVSQSDGATASRQARIAYFLKQTDEEITPDSDTWPTRIGTRQITVIADKVVDDRESEFGSDGSAIVHNVNIPLPGARPYGMGEPWRLKSLQRALSDSLDSMIQHQKFFAHPAVFMTDSMAEEMEERYGDAYIEPGRTIRVPDDLAISSGGKFDWIIEPPPLSPAAVQLFPILKGLIQEQSGNTEVVQGRASSQVTSGRAIEMLQSAATSMIGFKSQRTADMVRRLAQLMLHSLIWRLEPEDVYRIVSKYPKHVLEAIHKRAREIEWNVTINVTAGTGQLKMQKAASAMEQRAQGLISEQTALEDCNRDPRMEEQRKLAELQKTARMTMMQPQPAGAEGGQPPA